LWPKEDMTMRILIAEDDFTSRNVLAAVLKKAGHEVLETVDGAEAWEALQKPEAPGLVILDWMMPLMDGLDVLRRVRAVATDRPPYILMLTSRTEKAEIVAGLDAGANDYLAKPFDPGELRARVEVGRRMIEMQDALLASREAMTHQATHDPLTGIFNRRAIFDRLREEVLRARRNGDLLAVGICDIDHFKLVNDTHGHQTGDDVLCGFARLLNDDLREYDSVGRIGGEEFLIVAPMKGGKDCQSLFNRIRLRIVGSEISTRSGLLSVTVSIGVACAIAESTVDTILERADTALYRAKKEGRNRIVMDGLGLCLPRSAPNLDRCRKEST